jgi:hypothetical protein
VRTPAPRAAGFYSGKAISSRIGFGASAHEDMDDGIGDGEY